MQSVFARKFGNSRDHEEILLNERSEVISQCCNRNKYKLETIVSIKKTVESHNNGNS